jgi:hypothetical protein
MSKSYSGVDFYAEKTSARAGAALAGTILVVSRTVFNGTCRKAMACAKGAATVMPIATWVSPAYLAKCVKVTEAEARQIQPAMFAACEAFDRSPEFREMYAIEMSAAVRAKRVTLQPADGAILARIPTTTAEETDGPSGWRH